MKSHVIRNIISLLTADGALTNTARTPVSHSLRVIAVVVHADAGRGLPSELAELPVQDAVRDVALLRVEVFVVLGPYHRVWGGVIR